MKALRKQQALSAAALNSAEKESSSEEDEEVIKPKKVNSFAIVNQIYILLIEVCRR